MEHLALYRKYRPRTFEDVCGQEHITSVLKYESECGRLSHAYLFCGPRGTGKTTCAKILAKAVNCEHPAGGDPCGECFHCTSIDDGSATDVLEMDAASNTGVDYIRDIRDEVTYSPAVMKKRVYIIDEVHMLSVGAFNALLKTLEEPPEHVLFILATTEQHKLPATIVSRCQRFDFRRISVSDISGRLLHIAELENIFLDKTAAELIAKQAQGGMRDAINLFELCAGGGHDVTPERVREALGISGIENAFNVAAAVKENDMDRLFSSVANVVRSSKDISVFWQELISFWRDMLVAKNTRTPEDYLDLTESEATLLREAADRFSSAELIYHAGLLDEAMLSMNKLPQIKRNIAELTLIKMSSPSLSSSPDALAARLTALEDKIKLIGNAPAQSVNSLESSAPSQSCDASDEKKTEAAPPAIKKESVKESSARQDGFIPVRGKSELAEKIASLNPILKGFISSSEILVNGETNEVLIRCANEFTSSMLSSSDSLRTLSDSFVLCSITDTAPKIRIEVGEIASELDPFNEIGEI